MRKMRERVYKTKSSQMRRISSFAPVWKVGTASDVWIEGKFPPLSLDKKEIKFAPLKSDRSESFVGGGLMRARRELFMLQRLRCVCRDEYPAARVLLVAFLINRILTLL